MVFNQNGYHIVQPLQYSLLLSTYFCKIRASFYKNPQSSLFSSDLIVNLHQLNLIDSTMKNPNGNSAKFDGPHSQMNEKSKKKMKNTTRMGGGRKRGRGGLSLEAFANAKTKTDNYNPSLIKKQREFYKNAKYVNKYKKSLRQQTQEHYPSSSSKSAEDVDEKREAGEKNPGKRMNQNNAAYSLKALYEKNRKEEEKARLEREAQILAKKAERENSQSRRKALRDKMFKKTKSGQPVMKYRIEHILQTLQGSET